jgi:DNA polymerase III subunit delta'
MQPILTFDSILGQSQAITLLEAGLRRNRIAPAYLFYGAAGVGRKLTALAFINCLIQGSDRSHPDLLWVEPTYLEKGKMLTVTEAIAAGVQKRAAPQVRLEQIRQLSDFLAHSPVRSDRLVVVIEGAETMAESAANGLLKTLEEPGNATIILIAPTLNSLLPTLISRCQLIPFRRLSNQDLETILEQNGYPNLPIAILALAQGSPGAAIDGYAQYQAIASELLQSLEKLPKNPRQALTLAKQVSKDLDFEVQIWLLEYLQQQLWRSHHNSLILTRLEQARQQLQGYVQPRLVWEVLLLDLLI